MFKESNSQNSVQNSDSIILIEPVIQGIDCTSCINSSDFSILIV